MRPWSTAVTAANPSANEIAAEVTTRRLIDFGRGSVAARGVCSVTSAIVIREEPARSRAVESRTALARARERP